MADNQISVELVAKIDQLQSGLTEAVHTMKEAVDSIKESMHGLSEHAKEEEGLLKQILSGEMFIVWKEKAEVAIEAVKLAFEGLKESFETTIGAAEQFGLSTAKFAAIMHTSDADAAGLLASLRGVGVEASTYESIALRLQSRLQAGTGINKELADSLKGSNGEALTGQALMERLKDVMGEYNEEAQNAIVVQLGLGRKAADLYDAFRVTSESIEHQKDLYRDLGVDIDGTKEASQRLEEAENDLKTEVEALGIKIGQELMPYAEETLTWLGTNGKEFVKDLAAVVVELVKDMASLISVAADVVSAFATIGDVAKALNAGPGISLNPNDVGTPAALAATGKAVEQSEGPMTRAAGLLNQLADRLQHLREESEKPFRIDDPFNLPSETPAALARPLKGAPAKPGHGNKGAKDEVHAEDLEIRDAEHLALEKIKIEETTNAHLLAMGKETEDAFLAQRVELENRAYAVKLEGLNQELALAGRTKAQHQKTLDEIELLEVTHNGNLTKIEQEGETQRAAIHKQELANWMAAEDERLKSGLADIAALAAQGRISAVEKDGMEIALTQTIRREEIARLDAQLSTLTVGTKLYDEAIKQRQHLEAQLTNELRAENDKRRVDSEAATRAWITPMTTSFATAVNDMVLHGKNFADAMRSMAASIVQGFVQMCEQIAEKWIVTQITNATVAETTTAASAVSQVSSHAAVAGAGAAASQAGIPFIGPALAAGAAAAMIALVLGFQSLAHAEGGMMLDRDRLVYAHKEEMVLPRNISQGMQAIIASGGAGSGGGDTHNHIDFSPTIYGTQQQSLRDLIHDQPQALVAAILQAQRDGAFRPRI